MKRQRLMSLALLTLFALGGCVKKQEQTTAEPTNTTVQEEQTIPSTAEQKIIAETEPHDFVEINISPDKYTWYLKDYYGKNLASFGYTTMGGFRADYYGDGYIHFAFLTPNGEFIDIQDENDLKNWRVIGQNVAPNTEIKFIYEKEEDGSESENRVIHQSLDEVLLAVAPIDERVTAPIMTPQTSSDDPHIAYIRDYVGRNLTQCGYVSMGGNLTQQYGTAYIRLIVNAEDGNYVDVKDKDALKDYIVTRQSIAPNTKLKSSYENEETLEVHDQNIEEIDLYVVPLSQYDGQSKQTGGELPEAQETSAAVTQKTAVPSQETEPPTEPSTEATEALVNGMRPEFKEAMDAYEAFYKEYCDLLEKYTENPADFSILGKYADMLTKIDEVDKAFQKWDESDLNSEELKYYLDVNNRVLKMMVDVAG